MRFKEGNPVVAYLVTNQHTGITHAFTHINTAKAYMVRVPAAEKCTLGTYDLREAK